MGGAVSTGSDNNELTDNLREVAYIRTDLIERVFRAVDRGEYILPEFRMNAYKDQAWRCNHLHLSAPCIYSEVMEALCLAPGLSFLNMGSGTGYLSTMAGLILGSNGVNHGVEYYEDVISYALKKLEDFKRYSGAVDEFDFCEPKFMQGNCLSMSNERRYDRIYVGGACPEQYYEYMKQLLTVGGILVVPFNEQLLQVKRTSEHMWNGSSLLSVSFANLIMPQAEIRETLELLPFDPVNLQELCRSKIRNILRQNIEVEMPDLAKAASTLIVPGQQTTNNREKRRPTRPYEKHPEAEPNDNAEREQDVREYLGLVFDRVVGEGSVRLNGRRINCLNLFTGFDYETDEAEDFNMDATSQNDEGNDAEAVVDGEEEMDTAPPERKTDEGHASGPARQKFDSGVGDESHSEDMLSSHEDEEEGGGGGGNKPTKSYTCLVYEEDSSIGTSDYEETDDLVTPDFYHRRTVASPFSQHMFCKIQQLPLPNILKDYLNYYRN